MCAEDVEEHEEEINKGNKEEREAINEMPTRCVWKEMRRSMRKK